VLLRELFFRKARKETILKVYNTSVLPTFLYGSENIDLEIRNILQEFQSAKMLNAAQYHYNRISILVKLIGG